MLDDRQIADLESVLGVAALAGSNPASSATVSRGDSGPPRLFSVASEETSERQRREVATDTVTVDPPLIPRGKKLIHSLLQG
ncbi:MAG TPA: hypothetical protein VH008_30320 [Pseudonocardia sp.]|jgi:hypothetical protein|nr:hypothetical protein [Pseudonocardia sp.]